MVKIENLFIW